MRDIETAAQALIAAPFVALAITAIIVAIIVVAIYERN